MPLKATAHPGRISAGEPDRGPAPPVKSAMMARGHGIYEGVNMSVYHYADELLLENCETAAHPEGAAEAVPEPQPAQKA